MRKKILEIYLDTRVSRDFEIYCCNFTRYLVYLDFNSQKNYNFCQTLEFFAKNQIDFFQFFQKVLHRFFQNFTRLQDINRDVA